MISVCVCERESECVCDLSPSLCASLLGTEDDLEFYVRKCGDILGVTNKLPKEQQDAKHILEHIFFQVVEFKKLNQVHCFNSRTSNVWKV